MGKIKKLFHYAEGHLVVTAVVLFVLWLLFGNRVGQFSTPTKPLVLTRALNVL